jgi:hypothetical protein
MLVICLEDLRAYGETRQQSLKITSKSFRSEFLIVCTIVFSPLLLLLLLLAATLLDLMTLRDAACPCHCFTTLWAKSSAASIDILSRSLRCSEGCERRQTTPFLSLCHCWSFSTFVFFFKTTRKGRKVENFGRHITHLEMRLVVSIIVLYLPSLHKYSTRCP